MKSNRPVHSFLAVSAFLMISLSNCAFSHNETIAVIPQTTGFSLWEAEHAGAEAAAIQTGYRLYWNAPTRSDDVERQIQFVNQAVKNGDRGLILAPDQSLALITPVRRAIARNVNTVIVGSPLSIPPGRGLAYILNDDEETGRLVAERLGRILHGKGSVAIIGINPDVTSILMQVRACEDSLQRLLPNIHIVERRPRSYNAADAVQVAADILDSHPDLNAIWALSAVETGGTFVALEASHKIDPVKLIGSEQDLDLIAHIRNGQMDSLAIEDTYQMGYQAVLLISKVTRGEPVPLETKLEPTLVTRENVDTAEVQRQLSQRWNYQR
jgi:ribose transport system substrate-binding protein